MTATCPECTGTISFSADTVEGEFVTCPDCAAELEVVSLNPPNVELAPEVNEDWGQ